VFDVRRAREWTEALTRWCDAQAYLVPFRGHCLVHRCELFQLQGDWNDALQSARQACDWLAGPPAWDVLGSAYYQLAEIQRLRGEFREAAESYRQAARAGRDPEPGMSLLYLAQGQVERSTSSVRRALQETQDPFGRSRLLPAAIDAMLAAGDVRSARRAADELAAIASELEAPYLGALSLHALGAVLLAEGEPGAALGSLRAAQHAWADLAFPYHGARARVLLGLACQALGDSSSADLELGAARAVLEELGALPDLERIVQLTDPPPTVGALSPRESEVLALVAAGNTNRSIAAELVISEKTVERHLSNIFAKLRLSSRTEAAAYAYRHGLIR
jgi:DNA-binding NarL/FixJ family response regulator